MKAIGLDLGNKTLGIAISDIQQKLARPFATIRFDEKNYPYAIEELKKQLSNEPIEIIVLGLPKNMDGTYGQQAKEVHQFAELLPEHLDIPFITYDERLTTKLAQKTMLQGNMSRKKRKQSIDQEAATILLQSYLDQIKRGG